MWKRLKDAESEICISTLMPSVQTDTFLPSASMLLVLGNLTCLPRLCSVGISWGMRVLSPFLGISGQIRHHGVDTAFVAADRSNESAARQRGPLVTQRVINGAGYHNGGEKYCNYVVVNERYGPVWIDASDTERYLGMKLRP